MSYAETTYVSVERSRAEIESIVSRYGAQRFASGWDADKAMVQFEMSGRALQFLLPLPRRDEKRFHVYRPGNASFDKQRTPEKALALWEQACRSRWRALALAIKAKLEAVESGISVFDEEFLAHIVMPNGRTIGQTVVPQIAGAYANGKMPPLLLSAGGDTNGIR